MNPLNATWLNSEAIADTVMEWLRQPMTIATVASLGAHGLFFLGLPAVTGKAKLPDTRTVGVVTLTPEEMAQLPKTTAIAPSPAKMLPLPHSSLTAALPQGLPSGPVLPSLDLTEGSPTGSTFYNVPLGSLNPPSEGLFSPTLRQLINTPFSSASETSRSTSQPSTTSTSAPSSTKSPAASKEITTAQPTPSPTPTNPTDQPAKASGQSPSPTASQTPPTGASQPGSTSPAPAVPPRLASAEEVIAQKRKAIQELMASYNPEDATGDKNKATTKLIAWTSTQQIQDLQAQGNLGSVKLEPMDLGALKYPYFFDLPHFKPEDEILIGVLIQPNGVLDRNAITMLKGTGYPALNQFVVSELLKKTFPPSGKYELRTVKLTFKPDNANKPANANPPASSQPTP